MNRPLFTLLATSIAACATVTAAFAGPVESMDKKILMEPTPPPESPWEFRIEPYGWLTGIEGTTGVKGYNTHVDVGFDTVLDHLDIAAALELEVRYNRWGILVDGFYAELSAVGDPPGPLYKSTNADFQQVIAEMAIAYRVFEAPGGFVDLYAGARYNYLGLDLRGNVDSAGVRDTSQAASERIVDQSTERAQELAQERTAEFRASLEAQREAIADSVRSTIEAEADGTILTDLEEEIDRIRELVPNEEIRQELGRTVAAVAKERIELARANADAAIARLRASVDARLNSAVAAAEDRVAEAEKDLAEAIEKDLKKRLRTDVSADKNWFDPIIGFRAQWNITDRFFLAGDGNVGGFGLSSEFVWEAQATLGYSFTRNLFAEVGYRYLHTEYSNDGFVYNINQAGAFIGLGVKF